VSGLVAPGAVGMVLCLLLQQLQVLRSCMLSVESAGVRVPCCRLPCGGCLRVSPVGNSMMVRVLRATQDDPVLRVLTAAHGAAGS